MEEKEKGLTSYGLKIIAIISMFIDHAAAIVYERYLGTMGYYYNEEVFLQNHPAYYFSYLGLRLIGRLAFPLFIFLLVQGFSYTHSKWKYALRLFIFSLVSEVPFDLGFQNSFYDCSYQNVFFTLLLGFLCMWFSDFIYSKQIFPWLGYLGLIAGSLSLGYISALLSLNLAPTLEYSLKNEIILTLIYAVLYTAILLIIHKNRTFNELCAAAMTLFVTAVAMFAADNLLASDYGSFGVLAIMVAYAARDRKIKSMTLTAVVLTCSQIIEAFAFLDLFAIKAYNGKKGKGMKYFFYAFYPCHILILYLIAYALGLC